MGERGSPQLDVSIVTAAHNEVGNVEEFLQRSQKALKALGVDGEIVFVDDGSTDGTADLVESCAGASPVPIKLLAMGKKLGLANAMTVGFREARGRLICLLPSDLESHPDTDIPLLYQAMDAGCDIVAGCRVGRDDGKARTSAIGNWGFYVLFGHRWKDANWIKLIRRGAVSDLVIRDNWHSFLLPILASRGYRVREIETEWHRRKHGTSKFGWRRVHRSLVGAIAVKWHLMTSGLQEKGRSRAPGEARGGRV